MADSERLARIVSLKMPKLKFRTADGNPCPSTETRFVIAHEPKLTGDTVCIHRINRLVAKSFDTTAQRLITVVVCHHV